MNILQLAVELEEQLEKFYLDQANMYGEHGLAGVFRLLAREERKHAELLLRHSQKLDGLIIDASDVLSEAKELFVGMPPLQQDWKKDINHVDVYSLAQEKEAASIQMYEKLLDESSDEAEREVFHYLIGEEKKHYQILGEMADFVARPEEWVEDAEFGLRKEY